MTNLCTVEPIIGSKWRFRGSAFPELVWTVANVDNENDLYTIDTTTTERIVVDREWFRRRGIPWQ